MEKSQSPSSIEGYEHNIENDDSSFTSEELSMDGNDFNGIDNLELQDVKIIEYDNCDVGSKSRSFPM